MPAASVAPRWAEHFHWESGGNVLVLESEPPVRVVRGEVRPGAVTLVGGAGLATWSTTHVSLLEAFGGLGHWAGGSGCSYLQSEAALRRLEEGHARDFGDDVGSAMEQLLWHPPSAVTVYPFYDAFAGLAVPEGIAVLPIMEYEERHPLGRAEWMRAFGWLVGMEAEADSAFRAVEERYLALSKAAERVPSPRLKVFTGSIDGDAFWAPSGSSFIAQMLADAGVDYVFSDRRDAGSIPVPFESLLEWNEQVDAWGLVWFDPDSVTWPEIAASHPVYAQLRPRGGHVFVANSRTCDYFGALVAAPDVLLADLQALFAGRPASGACFQWIEVP